MKKFLVILVSIIISIVQTPMCFASAETSIYSFTCVEAGGVDKGNPGLTGSGLIIQGQQRMVYLKFEVSEISGKNPQYALLKFKCAGTFSDVPASTIYISKISDSSWTADSLNYNNMPQSGEVVGTFRLSEQGSVSVYVDLTNHITSDGVYSFVISKASSDFSGLHIDNNTAKPTLDIYCGNKDTDLPTAPSGVKAGLITHTSATIRWKASTDASTAISKYYVCDNGRVLATTVGENVNYGKQVVLNNLIPNREYNITILAEDLAGNRSPYSETVTFTTSVAATETLNAPTNLACTGAASDRVFLEWTPSNSDFETPISYEIYNGNTLIDCIESTVYTAVNLKRNTSYTFKVRAKDLSGRTSEYAVLNCSTNGNVPRVLNDDYYDFSYWEPLNSGGGGYIPAIDTGAASGHLYLASDMEGCYKSEDYGKTWRIINKGLEFVEGGFVAAHPTVEGLVFFGTENGLYRSENGGELWTKCDSGKIEYTPINQMSFDNHNPNVVYALPNNTHNREGTAFGMLDPLVLGCYFKSEDYGKTFRMIRYTNEKTFDFDASVYSLEVDNTDENVLYLSSDYGMFKSEDGGETWSELDVPVQNPRDIALSPNGEYLLACFKTDTGSEIYMTDTRSLSWKKLGNDIPSSVYYSPILFDPYDSTGSTIYLCSTGGAYLGMYKGALNYADATVSFSPCFETANIEKRGWVTQIGLRNQLVVFPKDSWSAMDKQKIMFTVAPHSVYILANKDDAEYKWNEIYSREYYVGGNQFFSSRGQESTYTNDIIVSPTNKNYIVKGMADNGLFESFDGGRSFRQIDYNYNNSLESADHITWANCFAFDPKNSNNLIISAGSGYGSIVKKGGIFKREINPDNPDSDAKMTLLAGWSEGKNGFPNASAGTIFIDEKNNCLIASAYNDGLYYCAQADSLIQNASGSFVKITDGNYSSIVQASNGDIFAAGGNGLIKLAYSGSAYVVTNMLTGSFGGVAVTNASDGTEIILVITAKDIYLSKDSGKSFKLIFNTEQLGNYDDRIDSHLFDTADIYISHIAADSQRIFVTTYLGASDKWTGDTIASADCILAGSLIGTDNVAWTNLRGSIGLATALNMNFDNSMLYIATRGNGAYRRTPSLIGNGSFDTDKYWNGYFCDTFSYGGKRSLMISQNGNSDTVSSDMFDISGCTTGILKYKVSTYTYSSLSKVTANLEYDGNTGKLSYEKEYDDISGRIEFYADNGKLIAKSKLELPATKIGEWVDVSMPIYFPDGTAEFCLKFESKGTGDAYIDEITMKPENVYDDVAPTRPLNISINANTVAFDSAGDNDGIAYYDIYIDGVWIAKTTETSYTFGGQSNWKTIRVIAVDNSMNRSLPADVYNKE